MSKEMNVEFHEVDGGIVYSETREISVAKGPQDWWCYYEKRIVNINLDFSVECLPRLIKEVKRVKSEGDKSNQRIMLWVNKGGRDVQLREVPAYYRGVWDKVADLAKKILASYSLDT